MKLVLSKQKNIYMIQSVFGMEEFFNFLMFVWSKYFEKHFLSKNKLLKNEENHFPNESRENKSHM